MGRVVLFKGQSQYDVLRIFIDQLGKGFKEQNKEVVIVDLLANDVLQQLQNAFQKPCDFVFAFNAMGIELQVNNRSLYDVMNVPFIASLVDDPVYHLSRLEQPVENMLITCVDRAHMNFINSYYGGQRTCVFLPHGGCKPIKSLKKAHEYETREIDVLFAGSYHDPDHFRNQWKNQSRPLAKLLDDIVEHILNKDYINLAVAADEVLTFKSIYLSHELSNQLIKLLPFVDKYVRAYRRKIGLQILAKAGIKIEIYGSNWENFNLETSNNIRIHPPINFLELLHLMQKSKIVLNIEPSFSMGGHERVFSAMLNAAVAVTNMNGFYSKEFIDGKEIVLYSWSKLDELPEKIMQVLSDRAIFESIRLAGQQKAETHHTWTERAKQILEFVDLYKSLKHISC